jgi:hypothetical protein
MPSLYCLWAISDVVLGLLLKNERYFANEKNVKVMLGCLAVGKTMTGMWKYMITNSRTCRRIWLKKVQVWLNDVTGPGPRSVGGVRLAQGRPSIRRPLKEMNSKLWSEGNLNPIVVSFRVLPPLIALWVNSAWNTSQALWINSARHDWYIHFVEGYMNILFKATTKLARANSAARDLINYILPPVW